MWGLGGNIHRPVVSHWAEQVDAHPMSTIPVPSVCVEESVTVGRVRGAVVKWGRGKVGLVEVEVEVERDEKWYVVCWWKAAGRKCEWK